MRAAMRIDLGPARLVGGRPGGLGGRASLRGRAGPALAGGFERRWAGSTDIFKVLSNLFTITIHKHKQKHTRKKKKHKKSIECA